MSAEFIRGILGYGNSTFVGAERANVRCPERGQVGTEAIGDTTSVCICTSEVTRVVRLGLRGNENSEQEIAYGSEVIKTHPGVRFSRLSYCGS